MPPSALEEIRALGRLPAAHRQVNLQCPAVIPHAQPGSVGGGRAENQFPIS